MSININNFEILNNKLKFNLSYKKDQIEEEIKIELDKSNEKNNKNCKLSNNLYKNKIIKKNLVNQFLYNKHINSIVELQNIIIKFYNINNTNDFNKYFNEFIEKIKKKDDKLNKDVKFYNYMDEDNLNVSLKYSVRSFSNKSRIKVLNPFPKNFDFRNSFMASENTNKCIEKIQHTRKVETDNNTKNGVENNNIIDKQEEIDINIEKSGNSSKEEYMNYSNNKSIKEEDIKNTCSMENSILEKNTKEKINFYASKNIFESKILKESYYKARKELDLNNIKLSQKINNSLVNSRFKKSSKASLFSLFKDNKGDLEFINYDSLDSVKRINN